VADRSVSFPMTLSDPNPNTMYEKYIDPKLLSVRVEMKGRQMQPSFSL